MDRYEWADFAFSANRSSRIGVFRNLLAIVVKTLPKPPK